MHNANAIMCLPPLLIRKKRQEPNEETIQQPSPIKVTGRRTPEATARLSNSKFSSNRSRRSPPGKQTDEAYGPGGFAASSSGPDRQHDGIYGGVQGGLYSGLIEGANGGVSGGVHGGIDGTSSGTQYAGAVLGAGHTA